MIAWLPPISMAHCTIKRRKHTKRKMTPLRQKTLHNEVVRLYICSLVTSGPVCSYKIWNDRNTHWLGAYSWWPTHRWVPIVKSNQIWSARGAYWLGAYNLGACSLELLDLERETHSLTGGPTVGGLQSPATRCGARDALTDWGPTVGGSYSLRTTRFETWDVLTDWEPAAGGSYSLGAYNLQLPDVERKTHSLAGGLQLVAYTLEAHSAAPSALEREAYSLTGGLQSGSLHSPATRFGGPDALTDWGPTVWSPKVPLYQIWSARHTHWSYQKVD